MIQVYFLVRFNYCYYLMTQFSFIVHNYGLIQLNLLLSALDEYLVNRQTINKLLKLIINSNYILQEKNRTEYVLQNYWSIKFILR